MTKKTEYFLYSCLIAPHNTPAKTIPLEACLTPKVFPTLDMCSDKTKIMADLVDFFKHKVLSRASQEQKNAAENVSNVDVASTTVLNYEAILPTVANKTGELYNGYIPYSTLYQYFCFLDCDGVLQKK